MKFDFNQPCPTPMTTKECHALIAGLWQQCQSHQETIESLTERLATNSSNSSLPPSHDSLRDRAQRNTHKNKDPQQTSSLIKRKQGAQPGHKGYGRALWDVSRVDDIILCPPEHTCTQCQEGAIHKVQLKQRKQVFDIQDGRLFVTEYQLYGGTCMSCNHKQRGILPDGVPKGILGADALGCIASLTGKYKLSKREARELLIDFYNLTVSIGSISNAEHQISKATHVPVDEVETALQHQTKEPSHHDETSHFNKHKLEWLWLSTTSRLTLFRIFKNRNQEAAKSLIGADYQGMIITDRYGAYSWIPSNQRQYCWSHLQRDFKKIRERLHPEEKRIGYCLLRYTKMIFAYSYKIRESQDCLDVAYYKKYLLQTIWDFSRCLARGKALKGTKTSAFCAKLIKEWKSLWHFVRDPLVSPTNNHAERQLRHAVLWRKKSFGTQSDRGKRYVERILTCVMTCKQQSKNFRVFVRDCLKAYWSKGVYPSFVKEPINSG